MPIEFRCHQCGKLLRTADDTAGKQAKCPSCGAIQIIPAKSSGDEEGTYRLSEPPPSASSPFAAAAQPRPTPFDADNPYASPMAPAARYDEPLEDYPRNGPPWERDGASITSFIETVRQSYGSITLFFQEMRREGGLFAPLGYGMLGGLVGTAAAVLYQMLFMALMAGQGAATEMAIVLVVCIVVIPAVLLIQMFIWAGILHLSLMLVGGARFPFEATFRVVAYSSGTTSLLLLIPICGQYINGIVQLIFVIIGLIHTHEISTGKGVLAVFLPLLGCCGVAVLFYAVIVAVAMAVQ